MIHAPLTGAQKGAVLLLLLDEPVAADLLRQLASDEVRAVGSAMLSVAEIAPAAIDTVLDEFLAASAGTAALGAGGSQVRAVLERALGTPRAGSVLRELGPPVTPRPFAALDWVAPPALAALLSQEQPQAAAVVLAHLPPARAARILALMPEGLQASLVQRLASLAPVAADVIAELERGLETKLADATPPPAMVQVAGPDYAAALLNGSPDQARLLAALRDLDPALTDAIAEKLFIFNDLLRLDARAMQNVVREIDPETLVVALKGATAALKAHVLAAMSARAGTQLQDDIDARGPMKLADVEAAQAEIAGVVRRLAEAGTVMLPGQAGGYV